MEALVTPKLPHNRLVVLVSHTQENVFSWRMDAHSLIYIYIGRICLFCSRECACVCVCVCLLAYMPASGGSLEDSVSLGYPFFEHATVFSCSGQDWGQKDSRQFLS